ncbi:glycosyltransferase family 2 protein [Methanobrevibacter sp.]|uniref:glycosyltransferase family 2 protein n=1 Tax=Methanobrevibacter sp. TaxID=66852 RepID=UPI00386B6CEE
MNKLDDSKKYNLTAIVLVYNGEPYLENCIQSLVDQTIEGLEILLINDASTDDSLSICRKFERDYNNVFVIDKEKNGGLASSANLGIQLARGEYVILVDNDDFVPSYAYEKLYKKAKEVDADVSIGKANLFAKYQMEMNFLDNFVWKKERVITDINEFPELFFDVFYWNNIIKKDLLIDNNVIMPEEIKIYADRCFTHRVYSHAKKISIITDCVYLWRKRSDSLSRTHHDIKNFIDRMDAYDYDLDYLSGFYRNYFNTLFRRALIPIKGILHDDDFEKIFYDRVLKLFKKGQEKVDNIYDNRFSELDNILAYLIINGHHDELKELLQITFSNQTEVFNENGKSYWKLPLFRDSALNIPDELFEIRYLQTQFINIEEISVNEKSILFKNIEIPKYYDLVKGEILFKGRANENEIYSEFCSSFEVEKIDIPDKNVYEVEIPLNELNFFEFYGIHFRFENKYGMIKDVKLSSRYVKKIKNNNDNIKILSNSKKSLRLISQQLDNLFEINYNDEELFIDVSNSDKIKKNIRIYLKNNTTFEKIFLDLNDSRTRYGLKWKFFLDNNTKYTFFMIILDNNGRLKKDIKMHERYVKNFEELYRNNDENFIKFYKTKNNIVKFISK